MSSVKELFPIQEFPKKPQRNFIKENIRKAKGCRQCCAEKKILKTNNGYEKHQNKQTSPSYFNSKTDVHLPTVKYNLKIVKHTNSSVKKGVENRNQSQDSLITCTSCQTCGQSLTHKSNNIKPSVNKNFSGQYLEKDKKEAELNKDYHRLSHEHEELEKHIQSKKSLDLSSYKKGEVPRYIKELNAKRMQEQQEKENQGKLAKLLGLNDPSCPLGHMLMPPEQIRENLLALESKYQSLIQELNKMPVSSDSFRIKRRKIEIEKELKDLEEKIKLHKTKKVFIKIPD